jgi:hypothetical protein
MLENPRSHAFDRSDRSFTAARIGNPVSFVRWIGTRDGWHPEVIHGVYQGRGSGKWIVVIPDEVQELSDVEWALYK